MLSESDSIRIRSDSILSQEWGSYLSSMRNACGAQNDTALSMWMPECWPVHSLAALPVKGSFRRMWLFGQACVEMERDIMLARWQWWWAVCTWSRSGKVQGYDQRQLRFTRARLEMAITSEVGSVPIKRKFVWVARLTTSNIYVKTRCNVNI